MNKLMSIARQFREEEDGAAMVEYSILIGIVAAASITAIIAIGGWVGNQFSGLCTKLGTNGAAGSTCSPG
ncbi:Flp family type IVb pilin [Pseudaminobacter soli (ex Li et al. 2025)]|uniref:Flp family type IVb pilin n=1 Tax=Pseudaminobacter soli (ex Li et al. 2025) TaxID=1295366 RepID=A0A2P7SDZ6_9HYPH|nr:Flp family type IVb pilin [Mesorhizobium soli]PSJ60736.1 Flp family type IVb pilin [Mesorhizobium soli]